MDDIVLYSILWDDMTAAFQSPKKLILVVHLKQLQYIQHQDGMLLHKKKHACTIPL